MIRIRTVQNTDYSIRIVILELDVFMDDFKIISLHVESSGIGYDIFKMYQEYAEQKVILNYDEYISLTSKMAKELNKIPNYGPIWRLETTTRTDDGLGWYWRRSVIIK